MRLPLLRCAVLAVLAGLALARAPRARAQETPPPGATYTGRAYDFRKISDGVWFAVGTGAVSAESNNAIVEVGDGLLVVDATTSPAAAWALLRELRAVTTKPVKWLVVTHYHYDHAYGIQSFPPGIDVISSEYTRAMIATGKMTETTTAQGNRRFANTQIETATKALDTATSEASKADIRKRREMWVQYLASLATLKPVTPNVTVSDRMTISSGGRDVQIVFPGRAHTDGDLLVWLPNERILATGDLMQPNLPFMGDGYLDHWADVIDVFRARQPAMVLPGHGDQFSDMAILARLSDYLHTTWAQTVAAKAKGMTPDQAAAALDLTRFDQYYPRFPGWTDEMVVRRRLSAVNRIYQLLDERK